ncbi:peptidoglycan-binding protein [Streptomyces yerevanensis]|uniref:peptidoglycan-binding protein n=1 Tax=Streptomyces yerevanensis TaxID=66378 RepID=UPI000A88CE37|nr:peptidoglycan-binding protein [Streptomyces yerevanensis]
MRIRRDRHAEPVGKAVRRPREPGGGSNRRRLGALVCAVAVVGAGGWFAGSQVRSPADVAASHRAPKAGPVTVAVERRPLTATVVAAGSVEFASPQALSLAGSVGSGTAGGTSGADGQTAEQRVTKAPAAGTKLKEGDVLMAVSGRPVLVLRGSVPMYRTIGPGTSGDDVTQLQKALRRLGFDPGSISGTFRQGTASAVTRWYKSKGYEAQQPSAADQQRLGELQQAVFSAQEALLTAKGASGGTDVTSSSETDTGTPGTQGTQTQGTQETQGTQDTELQKLRLKSAQKALDTANAALSAFQAAYGTRVPVGEVLFLPELPVRLDKVAVRAGDAPTGRIGTVTSSDLVVQAVVPGADATLLRRGMAVEVRTPDGKKAEGTVTALGDDATVASQDGGEGATTGADDSSSGTADDTSSQSSADDASSETAADSESSGAADPSAPVQLRVAVPEPGPLAGQAGASVTVTIEVGASEGPVLAVPVAAIRTSADGKARVQVERGGGVTDVPVTVGLSAAGLVEVKPTGGGKLDKGDRVVVGE